MKIFRGNIFITGISENSLILFLFCIFVVFNECRITDSKNSDNNSNLNRFINQLESAPEEIEIDGRKFGLEAYLWRDFMPFCPPDGQPLIALIRITAVDSLQFPASVKSDHI